jgi:hypothetical protein
MTQQRIEIEFIDASGNRGTFAVLQIVSIDGKPFLSNDDKRDVYDRISFVEGRIETLERTLFSAVSQSPDEEEQ